MIDMVISTARTGKHKTKLTRTASNEEKGLIIPTACRRSVEFVATGVVEAKGLDRHKERLDKHLEE